ncbi:MAG: hypothetical protein EBY16_03310 [Gammaproteobacteria bacterium]|nr:hypothetical protein [Gammaproteobacteria bacterium]
MKPFPLLLYFLSFFYSQILFAIPQNFPFAPPKEHVKIGYRAAYDYPDNFDPLRAYDEESNFYLAQIYESLYNIDYATDDFKITPMLAEKMPEIRFYNKDNQEISIDDIAHVEKTVYRIPIRHGIYYSPNPYLCTKDKVKTCRLRREVHAGDFVYAISRVSHPNIQSPFISILNKHLYHFNEYYQQTTKNSKYQNDILADSIRAIDDYTLEITIKGYYAQWMGWLRMLIFSPIPPEIGNIYDKSKDQVHWAKYSIGTGPMMFSGEENVQKIRLIKNPNYRSKYLNTRSGLQKLPMLDEIQFFVEKEAIPRWSKFLQGYYDLTSIPAESFETSIQISPEGGFSISAKLKKQGIQLRSFSSMSSYSIAFNTLDPVIGGNKKSARLLRQAISIVLDYQEFLAIFFNGRGTLAQGPVPPELLSPHYRDNYNSYVYQKIGDRILNRPLSDAKALMRQAGFPNGIDKITNHHLRLNLDVETRGLPEERAKFEWFRKQFAKIGIQLNIVENDINRYKQKTRNGRYQMVFFGWNADYPDPENFLMLFYGKNAQFKNQGPNYSNFQNQEYDDLFDQLQHTHHQNDKETLIYRMLEILKFQCVSVWGSFGVTLYLTQKWVDPVKHSPFTLGLMQYVNIHPNMREKAWTVWNQIQVLPFIFSIVMLILIVLPFVLQWWRLKKTKALRYDKLREKQC